MVQYNKSASLIDCRVAVRLTLIQWVLQPSALQIWD